MTAGESDTGIDCIQCDRGTLIKREGVPLYECDQCGRAVTDADAGRSRR